MDDFPGLICTKDGRLLPYADYSIVRLVTDALLMTGENFLRAAAVASEVQRAVASVFEGRVPASPELHEAILSQLELRGFHEAAAVANHLARSAEEARANLVFVGEKGPEAWERRFVTARLASEHGLEGGEAEALAGVVEERLLKGGFKVVTPGLIDEIAAAELARIRLEAGKEDAARAASAPLTFPGSERAIVYDAEDFAAERGETALAGRLAELLEDFGRVTVKGLGAVEDKVGFLRFVAAVLPRRRLASLRLCFPPPDVREAARFAVLLSEQAGELPEPAWVIPPARVREAATALDVLLSSSGRSSFALLSAEPPSGEKPPVLALSLPALFLDESLPPDRLSAAVRAVAEEAGRSLEGAQSVAVGTAGLCEAVEFLAGAPPHASAQSLDRAVSLMRDLRNALDTASAEGGREYRLKLDLPRSVREAAAHRDAGLFAEVEALCPGGVYLSPLVERGGETGRRAARTLARLTGEEISLPAPCGRETARRVIRLLAAPSGAAGVRFTSEAE